jgi:hypothetical protein
MQIYTQQARPELAVIERCRRCGRPGTEARLTVCVGCRALEEVARHIPPAQHWSIFR